jgi:coiled-coil domain-containing protein 130
VSVLGVLFIATFVCFLVVATSAFFVGIHFEDFLGPLQPHCSNLLQTLNLDFTIPQNPIASVLAILNSGNARIISETPRSASACTLNWKQVDPHFPKYQFGTFRQLSVKMQGFNMGRYHPPESLDKSLAEKPSSGFNRNRDGKSTQSTGPPTIRFEMPFAIWCTNCKPETIIGQGVRFNAQKTKVGNYYSTPIWGFRMRHVTCGGTIEIRTDPQAGDYIVQEGARKRDYGDAGEDPKQTLLGEVVTAEDKAKRAADPFASLEGRVDQKEQARKDGWWVEKIQEHKDRDWDDVWTANRRLRQTFRTKRKILEAKDKDREEIADRMGLHIDVLDEIAEDGQRAALMHFGESEESTNRNVTINASRPLFAENDSKYGSTTQELKTKAQKKAATTKAILQQNIKGNTRVAIDPFVVDTPRTSSRGTLLAGVKRKRSNNTDDLNEQQISQSGYLSPLLEDVAARQAPLVSYSSSDGD